MYKFSKQSHYQTVVGHLSYFKSCTGRCNYALATPSIEPMSNFHVPWGAFSTSASAQTAPQDKQELRPRSPLLSMLKHSLKVPQHWENHPHSAGVMVAFSCWVGEALCGREEAFSSGRETTWLQILLPGSSRTAWPTEGSFCPEVTIYNG